MTEFAHDGLIYFPPTETERDTRTETETREIPASHVTQGTRTPWPLIANRGD